MQIANSVNALQTITQAFNDNAAEIASNTTASLNGESPKGDLLTNVTNLITLPAAQEANVKAIQSADEMLGSLLDIKI